MLHSDYQAQIDRQPIQNDNQLRSAKAQMPMHDLSLGFISRSLAEDRMQRALGDSAICQHHLFLFPCLQYLLSARARVSLCPRSTVTQKRRVSSISMCSDPDQAHSQSCFAADRAQRKALEQSQQEQTVEQNAGQDIAQVSGGANSRDEVTALVVGGRGDGATGLSVPDEIVGPRRSTRGVRFHIPEGPFLSNWCTAWALHRHSASCPGTGGRQTPSTPERQ